MKRLKIFGLLSCLTREEIKGLLAYVEYAEREAGREYLPLLKELVKFYPYFNGTHLTLHNLYNTLYPGREYNNRVIISRLSELNRLVEDFLVQKSLEKNPTEKDLLLLEELLSRNQFKLFNSLSDRSLESLRSDKIGPGKLLAEERLMNKIGRAFAEQQASDKMIKHIHDNLKLFTTFSITNTLSMATGLFAYRGSKNFTPDTFPGGVINHKFISKTIRGLKKDEPLYSSYIELWYLAHKFYTLKRADKEYYDFVELFHQNIRKLDRVTLQLMFILMYSYCVMQDKSGRKEFRKDLYTVLKDMIKHEAYQPQGNEQIPLLLFREVVRTGIMERDYEWVESFIKSYYTKTEPSSSQSIYNYGMGFLEAHKSNFEAGLNYLRKAKSDVTIIEIDIRLLLQITYYELKMYDEAKHISLSNRQFIKNKKIKNEEHQHIIKNFNEIYSKLLRSRVKDEITFDPGELRKSIDKKTPLYFKKWFIDKFKQLEVDLQ